MSSAAAGSADARVVVTSRFSACSGTRAACYVTQGALVGAGTK